MIGCSVLYSYSGSISRSPLEHALPLLTRYIIRYLLSGGIRGWFGRLLVLIIAGTGVTDLF